MERFIGTIKQRISAMCEDRGMDISDWDLLLPEAVLLDNNQVNKSLKYSPFMHNFGNEGRLPIDNFYGLDKVSDKYPVEVVQGDALANRVDAQLAYKREYDKKAVCKRPLAVGDMILLKRTYGKYPKMSVKWMNGPYKLVKKVGKVNWVVVNSKGKEKIYHQDMIKHAGVPARPHFSVSHEPYSLSVKPIKTKINITSPIEPSVPTNVNFPPQVTTSIDLNSFRDNVFSSNAQGSDIGVQTRSGRTSKPVVGNRLIDHIGQ